MMFCNCHGYHAILMIGTIFAVSRIQLRGSNYRRGDAINNTTVGQLEQQDFCYNANTNESPLILPDMSFPALSS